MNNFKEASKIQLRFETSQGLLSAEQLWALKLPALATIVRNLKKQMVKDNDNDLSFLDEKPTAVDKTIELRFNIVKEVYQDKKNELESARDESAKKERNQKILGLIAEKQEGALKEKSLEELTAMLEE